MSAVIDSDYLIFADESGDHGLVSIDEQFPVFALVFCIVRKQDYVEQIVPAMQWLKMAYWGHDQVILHEHDIRKEKGPFAVLRTDRELRERFMNELTELISAAPMQIIVSVIDKHALKTRYTTPYNPYEVALLFCLERTLGDLCARGERGKRVHVLFESRGRQEDADLELEFRRICDHGGGWGYRQVDFQQMQFAHLFVDKRSNSTGLQLADLVARPLALRHLRPGQPNRALQALDGKVLNFKVFP
jgi:hypothetical protein